MVNFTHFSTFSSLVRDDRRPGKCQVYFRTGHEGPQGEYGCSCILPLTSALDGGGRIGDRYLQNLQSRFGGFSKVDTIKGVHSTRGVITEGFFEHFIKTQKLVSRG
jgi:hypothetical protein